ncbi:MAG: hypothetical protein LPK46_05125 [Bacteroidota bacterium]|nr:hypothetical protein [Bacteroidota bacterium]MDX5427587.1 hypothetical protein [Bacteroidota bacterium]MDX5505502.1 hypothetical protein [Bacteroidota bacterium]
MKIFQKVISIFISLLILGYSGGLTVSTHFCNEDLVDRSIILPAKKCEAATKSAPQEQDPHFKRPSCCLDFVSEFKSQQFSTHQKIPFVKDFFPSDKFEITSDPVFQDSEPTFLIPNTKAPPDKVSRHIRFEQFLI